MSRWPCSRHQGELDRCDHGVYAGTNPDTGKRRYRTATVTGNRSDAERALARLVADVRSDKTIGSTSTVSELLEAWFAIVSTSWAPTTTREIRSTW